MMTVLGLSLLSCPHCEAGFPTVPTLNNHIEQEHKHKKNSINNLENGLAGSSSKSSSLNNVSIPISITKTKSLVLFLI